MGRSVGQAMIETIQTICATAIVTLVAAQIGFWAILSFWRISRYRRLQINELSHQAGLFLPPTALALAVTVITKI